jgi:hypothetical protein
LLSLGNIFDSIFIPVARAFGGIKERNSRADFERREKGLNWTRTSVRNLVIIFCTRFGKNRSRGRIEGDFYSMLITKQGH